MRSIKSVLRRKGSKMTEAMKGLQERAVNKLFEIFDKLNKNNNNDNKEITFKAPTGSGKTYMMSALMNRILSSDENAVFLVSTLSKGGLAEQNYEAFLRFKQEKFKHLKPFLIESGKGKKIEGMIEIPRDCNVYVLARDLFKETSILKKQSVLLRFLKDMKGSPSNKTQTPKKVYLIKDECHQATNNLDELAKKGYFNITINISATPKNAPDVKIEDKEAVDAGLIKEVEWRKDEEYEIEQVLEHFEEIRSSYIQNQIGIRPCLIIQISNKDKADEEIKRVKEAISKRAALKYMIILDESNANKCETNDAIKKQNLSIKKWKSYAKENQSSIDIIVFKMVISEGFDIPRACMLYQIRDSKSKQLDEQVIGRVRRNPRLLDYENLNKAQQELINKAYVYGIEPKNEEKGTIKVRLKGQINEGLFKNEILNEFKIQLTRLDKSKIEKSEFNIEERLKKCKAESKRDFFELFEEFESSKIGHLCKDYAKNDAQRWFAFANNVKLLKKEFEKIITDYNKSLTTKDENGQELVGALALDSFFIENKNKLRLNEWIWDMEKSDETDDRVSFDSKAEYEFAKIMKDILKDSAKELSLSNETIYLFGKNFPHNSQIKFEYYLEGYYFSYPDFILRDKKEQIHIFELKSLDSMNSSHFIGEDLSECKDEDLSNLGEYERKIVELQRIYKAISKKTPYYFWLPIKQKDEEWFLHCFKEGKNLYNKSHSKEAFKNELKKQLG